MATSNRDVTLKLSVETLGEDGIKELQKAVEALGRDGGAAAPEFQRLADEIGRLGEQSKALSTFRELSEETDKLASRQAESAASTAQMAAKLQELAAATAQARDRQREATNDLVTGQQAQAKATAALRELKAEYNAAGKNTKDYRDKLLEAVQAQSAANIELVTLRQNQKEANAEVTAAVSEQSKQETQVKKSAAQTDRLAEALQKQTDALRESTTAAEALGVSTEDVAQSEGRLLVALQASAQTANQRSAAIKGMTEADRLLAIEEKAMADLLARGQAALQAETLAQRDAARATEQYAATKREAAAANDAWQKEAEALVNAAHAAQQLARETEILAAAQRELANQNAFEKQATEAQKLLQAAQYVKFWENALEQAETQVKQTAEEAQRAAQRIDTAFGTLGVRSVQAVQQEIVETRAAMTTLAAESARTGTSMAGAFAAGENKIKTLEREIRELSGTLTLADKAAGLFGTLGVRSVQAVQQEIVETRAAMTALAAESQRTGTSMAGAFAVGENKIKTLEREIRELSGTLTLADKAAGLFSTLGVRSVQAVQQEIVETRAAMTTLAAESTRTGTSMAGAFSAGEAKIKGLEREIRELNGTLTLADKSANLFRNSLGQIAAGNLVADAIGSIVERVKDMGKQFVAAIVQLDTFRRALNAVYKDSNTTASQLAFLRKAAGDSGVAVGGLSSSFVKFSASMKSANVPIEQSNALFASLTRAAGTLGLGAERTSLALDALSQIASKGVVSMEELRQQLGDALPGALGFTTKGLGITDAELNKLVESGQLASRDFFPAFNKGLEELRGETEGLVPTWERLKNAFALTAQNAGDSGWAVLLAGALKVLGAAAGALLLVLSALSEGLFTAGRAAILLFETLRGNGAEALAWFQEESRKTTERLNQQGEAFMVAVSGVKQQTAAITQLAPKLQEVADSTDGLTNSQKLAAIAAKLNGDTSFDAAAKYVQLSIATATLIKQQENETLNLEKLAKAKKEEGETLIALAKLRGDEQGILEATSQAAEEYAAASARVAASKQEELRILEQQLVAKNKELAQTTLTTEQKEKETEKLRELIKTKQAEVEQTKASTEAAKQEVAARKLAVEMYGDQSAKMGEFRAEMERLTAVLKEYERLNIEGKKSDEQVSEVRRQLAEATAKYRDTVNDLIANTKLEYQAKIQNVEATRSALDSEAKLYTQLAANAKSRGDLNMANYYETESKKKSIEASKLALEIKKIELELEKAELAIKIQSLVKNDALYASRLKELQLRQQMNDIRTKALGAEKELLRLKENEVSTTNTLSGALGKEANARDQGTAAMTRENAERQKSLALREQEVSLLEKELNLKDREETIKARQGKTVMAPVDNVPTFNSRDEAEVWLEKFKKDYRTNNNANTNAGMWGTYLYDLAMAEYKAEMANVASKEEVARRQEERSNQKPVNPGAASMPSTPGVPNPPLGIPATSTAGSTPANRTVTVNINGRNLGAVNGLNDQQAAQLTSVLRGLENAQGTAA